MTHAAIDQALADAYQRFTDANPASLRQFEAQARYMPGANSRSVLFYAPFPLTIARGEGAALWDADGHRYTDFIAEYTAGVYGHSAPEIREAVIEAMQGGINLTGHNMLEGRLARLICERFPQIEQLRFTNSGTEANLMALTAALHFTGRKKIVVFSGGYHGGVLGFGARPSSTSSCCPTTTPRRPARRSSSTARRSAPYWSSPCKARAAAFRGARTSCRPCESRPRASGRCWCSTRS